MSNTFSVPAAEGKLMFPTESSEYDGQPALQLHGGTKVGIPVIRTSPASIMQSRPVSLLLALVVLGAYSH